MRRLVRLLGAHQIVIAYALIVAVFFVGLVAVQRVNDRNTKHLCELALTVTERIPLPPATTPTGADNSFAVGRTKTRNAQLARERELLVGKDPHC